MVATAATATPRAATAATIPRTTAAPLPHWSAKKCGNTEGQHTYVKGIEKEISVFQGLENVAMSNEPRASTFIFRGVFLCVVLCIGLSKYFIEI